MAIEETAACAGSWTFVQAHLERSLLCSVVPQSRPSPRVGRTRRRADHRWNRWCSVRGS